MKRGDIVVSTLPGDKPRPVLVVQSNDIRQSGGVIVCPFTSGMEFRSPHRVFVAAGVVRGLAKDSVLMTERLQTVRRERCGNVVGELDIETMRMVDARLAYVLGLVDSTPEIR